MPNIPLQAFFISILGLALGCGPASPDGSASSGALEDLPNGADECKGRYCGDRPDDGRCLDWYDGDECQFECPSPPEGEIRVFEECGEIHISSCKDLSNVVLLCCEDDPYEEGECETLTEYKIDNLHEQRLSLQPLEDWHCKLVGLCVKAGNNAGSGVCDGPGYGEHIEEFVTLDEDCDGAGGNGGDGGGGGTGGSGATGGDDGSGGTGGGGGIVVQ